MKKYILILILLSSLFLYHHDSRDLYVDENTPIIHTIRA
jgi:hypothetical protein